MANEILTLRKGLLENLSSAPVIEGALSFTTDEPAIYIDVEGKHLRIGDIKEFANLTALKDYLKTTPEKIPTTGLYYAIAENALMKYTGTTWQQINVSYDGSIEGLEAKITAINTALGSKPEGWSDTSIWAAIKKNRDDIAAEQARAEGVEDGLRTDVNAVRADLGTKDDGADADTAFGRIAAEQARAEAAESGLSTSIGAEKTRAEGVEAGLRNDLGNKTDSADVDSAFGRIAKNVADIATANGEIAKKANSADVYTKTQIDNTVSGLNTIIDGKADKATTLAGYGITNAYTKTEVEGLISEESEVLTGKINGKADKATTLAGYGITDAYNQTEIDNKVTALNTEIDKKANKATSLSGYGINDAYTKTEVDNLLSTQSGDLTEEIDKKADKATTLEGYGITDAYTKGQVDTAISNASAAAAAETKKVADDLAKLNSAVGEVPVGETVVGLIDKTATAASGAAAKALEDAKAYTDAQVKTEKERAEAAEAGLSTSITTLRSDMNTLIGTVPEGSDNVIDYINDSQAAQDQAITTAYKAYVDEKLRVADGMTYKGIINFSDKVLPVAGVQAGDTYKVAANGVVNGERVYVGDLIIANSDQTGSDDYADWDIVHSGYEDDHDVHVELNDGAVEIINAAGASRGSIKVQGNYSEANGGVKVTLSSADADPAAPGVEVTATVEMVWGSF